MENMVVSAECTENAQGMVRRGLFLGYAVENTHQTYWVVDGKVWSDKPGEVCMIGDYFEFMDEVKQGIRRIYKHKVIGSLHEGHRFTCLDCDATGTPVFRVNIGIYSQRCSKCKRLIVEGVKKANSTEPLSLYEGE